MSIAAIVNFCTNETRFIKTCLEEALKFSSQVVVPVCDHFFDGTPENRALLEKIYCSFPECTFVEYPFVKNRKMSVHNWHSLSRLLGFLALDRSIERVLFLDADEVVDGEAFKQWASGDEFSPVQKLANYWYFRDEENRAKEFEDSAVFIERRLLNSKILFHKDERDALYDHYRGPKKRMVLGVNGKPMIHHYSWVRTKKEMLKKVKAWGHHRDKDWEALIEKEFSGPFQGKDFIHGYTYTRVPSRLKDPSFEKKGLPNVIRCTSEEVKSAIKKGRGAIWNLIFRSNP